MRMVSGSREEYWVKLADAPTMPGLRFRYCRGEPDYKRMAEILKAERDADQVEYTVSIEDIERGFKHLENCDPCLDFLFAEVDGKAIGYSETSWAKDTTGGYLYFVNVHLLPEWRGKGVRDAMLRGCERRLREVAKTNPRDDSHLIQSVMMESEKDWASVLERHGYRVYRFGLKLRRASLEDVPDLPFPEGIEVRPVKPEHVRAVVDAWNEACKDMRSQIPISDEGFKEFQEAPIFDTSLWQVAWHEDKVVGTVMNFINEAENEQNDRKRGYVELISVQRPWRRKGIAKAMIAKSLKVLKERGMTEAALGVDAENPSGALHLYETLGFRVEKRVVFYRKPMA